LVNNYFNYNHLSCNFKFLTIKTNTFIKTFISLHYQKKEEKFD
jgi:hypothetical protein